MHCLALANPIWYPNLESNIRMALLNFAENVLETNQFEPAQVNTYLQVEDE